MPFLLEGRLRDQLKKLKEEFGIIGAAIATAVTQFLSLFVSNLFCKDSKNIFWIQLKGINPLNIIRKDLKKLF